jgi:RNA polymerase sigma factor (sigma-70 family)
MALPGVTTALVAAAQAGDADAMWQLVSAHDPIIRRIIQQVAPGLTADRAEDLLQEGRAELIHRIRQYDPSASAAQLQTYAYPHIRRVIAGANTASGMAVTADPTVIMRVRRALADYDGNPELALLALQARHGGRFTRETMVAAMEACRDSASWDAPIGSGDEGLTIADVTAGPGFVTDPAERRSLARYLLTVMTPRQSYAMAAHHGVGMQPATDSEVADHLRMKRVGVRQLRSAGAERARKHSYDSGIAA